MKLLRILVAAVLVFSAGVSWAPTSEGGSDVIVVIVNPANPASVLGVNELRPIFQTMKTSWSTGGDAVPVNLPEDNPVRHDFDRTVLGLDPDRVARYWKDRKIRGGARAPIRVSNSGAMLKAVAAKPGAVGYVKASEVNASVKVVAKIANGKLSGP
jgi:ABC-type phosphate transport system substrate-binding protein